MNITEFRKSFLATFLAVGVALVMLPGCSSTSESSDSGGDTAETSAAYEACMDECKALGVENCEAHCAAATQ